ncbi:MAG: hypothetical protein KatS3mg068_2680 [Candidatus Sericytochromatia bacterium]|nr:MAG: hypothetical protein KatS3mg068_2680 [Candidatus Sericytochromatia bacterium]
MKNIYLISILILFFIKTIYSQSYFEKIPYILNPEELHLSEDYKTYDHQDKEVYIYYINLSILKLHKFDLENLIKYLQLYLKEDPLDRDFSILLLKYRFYKIYNQFLLNYEYQQPLTSNAIHKAIPNLEIIIKLLKQRPEDIDKNSIDTIFYIISNFEQVYTTDLNYYEKYSNYFDIYKNYKLYYNNETFKGDYLLKIYKQIYSYILLKQYSNYYNKYLLKEFIKRNNNIQKNQYLSKKVKKLTSEILSCLKNIPISKYNEISFFFYSNYFWDYSIDYYLDTNQNYYKDVPEIRNAIEELQKSWYNSWFIEKRAEFILNSCKKIHSR